MKKLFQTFVMAMALLAFTSIPAFAQEYGVKWTRGVKHITTKTTTNITTATVVLHTLIINVSNAGTSWTIAVQDKATTPHILYAGTVVGSTVVIELPVGVTCDSGIDVVTAGSTAGVMDVWYAMR